MQVLSALSRDDGTIQPRALNPLCKPPCKCHEVRLQTHEKCMGPVHESECLSCSSPFCIIQRRVICLKAEKQQIGRQVLARLLPRLSVTWRCGATLQVRVRWCFMYMKLILSSVSCTMGRAACQWLSTVCWHAISLCLDQVDDKKKTKSKRNRMSTDFRFNLSNN